MNVRNFPTFSNFQFLWKRLKFINLGFLSFCMCLNILLSFSSVRASLVFHPINSSNRINRKVLSESSRKQVIGGINLITDSKLN